MNNRIVIAASSDIGSALCNSWIESGNSVAGTYRKEGQATTQLEQAGARLVQCNLLDRPSVDKAAKEISQIAEGWDMLVLAPATQEPVGKFEETSFSEWEDSILVNFTRQLQFVHALLPSRNRKSELGPLILFFAGGGTNSAPPNYSAYTVSKIAQIKISELLDSEIPDVRFSIVGPGWVRTKIHEETLKAGTRAGANLQTTIEKLEGDDLVPMEKVIECCDWIVNAPQEVIGGRNISLVFDNWGSPELDELLRNDSALTYPTANLLTPTLSVCF